VLRFTRSRVLAAVVVCAALAWVYLASRASSSSEAAALERVARVVTQRSDESGSARDARIRAELPELLTEEVTVSLPDGRALRGRDAAVAEVVARAHGQRPVVSVQNVRRRGTTREAASVDFELVVSDSQASDLHAAPRPVRAELVRGNGVWRLRSLNVGFEAPAEPEPRP
jgi:hypothetical protein